jgi:hypothetical protein
MRRLCRSVTGMTVLAIVMAGCGSSTGGEQVMRFIGFDTSSLVQQDSVGESGALVDVEQDDCVAGQPTGFACGMSGLVGATCEPFTPTEINAVFLNEGAADIHLTGYVVDAGTDAGLAPRLRGLGGDLRGGRCSTEDLACSSDLECSSNGTIGMCIHTETLISNIILFDLDDKAHINLDGVNGVRDQTTQVTITFFGQDDSERSFEVSTDYSVVFSDVNDCSATHA